MRPAIFSRKFQAFYQLPALLVLCCMLAACGPDWLTRSQMEVDGRRNYCFQQTGFNPAQPQAQAFGNFAECLHPWWLNYSRANQLPGHEQLEVSLAKIRVAYQKYFRGQYSRAELDLALAEADKAYKDDIQRELDRRYHRDMRTCVRVWGDPFGAVECY
jgi:hypothetical protein